MPKRRNPFTDSLGFQLKTYVREKEVNNGVCQQIRMQSVYDRTQQLLFAGMKGMQNKHVSLDANENLFSYKCEAAKTDKPHRKQMHITKDCQLVSHGESNFTDMETDSDNSHGYLSRYKPVNGCDSSSSAVVAADGCSEVLSSFGISCGRSPLEYSPSCALVAASSSNLESSCGMSSNSDAFSHMKQAQLKKTSRECCHPHAACHNCRQTLRPQDMIRCQFCESCVCCACSRQCASCLLHFCQLCSVINYDLPTERPFCLNCHER